MNNYESILKSIGLDNNEARVYLEAIKLGTTQASIIGNSIGIPRTTARYACEELCKKKLMSKVKKGNSMLFTAEKPDVLRNQIIMRKNLIEKNEDDLNKIMGDLMNLYNPYTKLPKVTFYEGVDGIKKVLDDSLNSKEVIDSFADIEGILKNIKDINLNYAKNRIKKLVKKRAIINYSEDNVKYIESLYNDDINEYKILKDGSFSDNLSFMIYDGKISYITFNNNNLVGVIIENDDIYNFHKKNFNYIWGTL